ncbi:hypothetical protein D8T45_07215 [Vibrio vulnificus]|nr:hypothetical protein D8T45_07215 [Vibrio vulnificus]RZR17381.1 hypothetical protein D8T24_06505 [Vibrio vulnificus]
MAICQLRFSKFKLSEAQHYALTANASLYTNNLTTSFNKHPKQKGEPFGSPLLFQLLQNYSS